MATLSFYLDVAHPRQDGTCALKMVIRNRSTAAHFATGYFLPSECWNGSKVVLSASKKANALLPTKPSILNTELSAYLAKVTLALNEVTGKKSNMSASVIKTRVTAYMEGRKTVKNTEVSTFLGAYEEYISTLKKADSAITMSNPMAYIRKNIPRAEEIQLDDIDREWAEELVDTMLNGTENSQPLHNNTVYGYISTLNCVWNYAVRKGYTSEVRSPFRDMDVHHQGTKSRALTIEQLRELWHTEPKKKNVARALDMFKLSFMLCGLNPADMFSLLTRDIVAGRVDILRHKTGVPINIQVLPEAREILDRYKSGQYLLGKVITPTDKVNGTARSTNYKINLSLKKIMPGLTMYYARHTWMSIGAELDIPDRVLFMGIAHKMGKYSDETYITMRHRKLDLANRKILDYVLQQGEFAPEELDNK